MELTNANSAQRMDMLGDNSQKTGDKSSPYSPFDRRVERWETSTLLLAGLPTPQNSKTNYLIDLK